MPGGNLSCVCGFADSAWDRLFGDPRPAALHPFREFGPEQRRALATPGDLLLHIRAEHMDLCFELATQLMAALGDAVTVVDEVQGFRYFDMRSIIGFVDGTENPVGRKAEHFTLIGAEDPAFSAGSYVLVQKYLHNMQAWNALTVEAQERVIGRSKLADIELDESVKPSCSHSALTVLEQDGEEVKILRDNMPFGRPGAGEFGTYFIGYARSPEPIEQMLENMFVGKPAGNYDRLLDFSTAVTGGLFFVPSADGLEALAERTG
ncbi:putative deferrochelatase/peroxidase YfeX [compost metagenome]